MKTDSINVYNEIIKREDMNLDIIYENTTVEDQDLKPNIHKERDINLQPVYKNLLVDPIVKKIEFMKPFSF